MICNVPYIEERFRESNPDIADILNQEYETIFNKLIESKLFKNEDNTLKLSYAKTKKYLKQLDFINNINQEYETEIVTNINRTISVNVLPLYNKLDVINKPKYYMKDNVSVKTNINLERVPVQQVIIDINKEILDTVTHVLEFLNNNGFNPVIVGGAVRDAIVGDKPKDIDIEVYGITVENLESILSNYGKVDAVGKSFGVLKFIPYDANGKLVELEEPFDFSVPRRENKVGLGYKGFEIELSDDISIEEAATRRDFTWNSMGYNPITNTLYDYYGGINDLAEGIIRHTSPKFAEDPLRILRAMQFQARKGHVIAPETYELMNNIVKSIKDKINVDVDIDVKSSFDESINGLKIETTEEYNKNIKSLLEIAYEYVQKLLQFLKNVIYSKNYTRFFEITDSEVVIMIKPLGYELGATKIVEDFIRDNGGSIVEQKELVVDSYRISQHYGEGKANFKNKSFFSDMVEYYTGKKVKVYKVKLNSKYIKEMRDLMGDSSGFANDDKTIRKTIVGDKYRDILDTQFVLDNGIHMSDSIEEGVRESYIWFGTPQIITTNKEAIKTHVFLWKALQKIDTNVQFSGSALDGTEISSKLSDLDYRLFSDDVEGTIKKITALIPDIVYEGVNTDEESGLLYHKLQFNFSGGKADITIVPNHKDYTDRVSENHLAVLMADSWKVYARKEKEYYYQKVITAEQQYGKDSDERLEAKRNYENIKKLLRQQVNEWFSTKKAFKDYNSLIDFAKIGKNELDDFLDSLDTSEGLKIKKAPLKSLNSLKIKANSKYHGRLYKAGDIGRATIVLNSNQDLKEQIDYIFKNIKENFPQFTVDNYFKYPLLGYKGINISLLTKNDGRVELQINTPEMIFMKEPKKDAILYLGLKSYNDLVNKYGDIGGYGHKLYDLIKITKDPAKLEILKRESVNYYENQVIPESLITDGSNINGEFDHLATNELYNTFLKEKMRLVAAYAKHIKDGGLHENFYELDKYEIFTSMITRERILGEWDKWATKGKYHSKLFDFLRQSGLGEKLYPELMQLVNTKQDTVYHPEGNVEEHTKQVLAKANEIAEREKLSVEEKQILMLSSLLHDIAKPETTKEEWSDKLNRFKVTSRGHEQAGEAIALDLLERIGIKEDVRIKVGKLIAEHLAHATISSLPSSDNNISPLSARGVFDTTALIEHENDKVTFLMYDLLGKIVGRQFYNPEGKKVAKNKNEPLKYILKGLEGQTLIFGMHTYNPDSPYLFVVEGVFDALMLHQQGYPAIAVLSAVPDRNTKNQIELLNGKKIGILDNDVTNTGLKLRNFVDEYHVVPIEKDLNDLYTKDITEFNKFITELDKKYKAAKGMYKPLRTSHSFSKQKKSAFAKLVNRLAPANVEQLVMLMEADMLGRNNNNLDTPVSITEFMELLEDYKNTNKGKLSFEPILTGKHLIKAGVKPGKGMGEILAKAKEAQLNLDFTDETESLEWLSNYLSTQDNDTILLEDKVKGKNMKELSIKTVISNIRTLLPKSNVELLNTLIESIKQNESSPILILAQMSREYKNGTLDKADLLAATFDKMADKNKEAIMAAIKSSYNMSDDNDVMNKLGELLVNKDNALILSSGVLGSLYRGVHNFFNSFEGNKEDIVKTISTIYDIDDTITDDMILHSERFKLFNKNNPYTSEKENLEYFKKCT